MATVEVKVRISTIQGDMCSDELEDAVDKAVEQAGRTSGARSCLGSSCRPSPCAAQQAALAGPAHVFWLDPADTVAGA